MPLLIKLENITRVSKVKSVVDFNTRLRGYRVKSVLVLIPKNVGSFQYQVEGAGGTGVHSKCQANYNLRTKMLKFIL